MWDARAFYLMYIVGCPSCRISCKAKGKVQRNPEEIINEDEDVMVEKARVREALTCQCCEEVRIKWFNNNLPFRYKCLYMSFYIQ